LRLGVNQWDMAARRHIPNAENCSMAELETAIKAAPTQRANDRLRAMKALVLGLDAPVVAELFSVSPRTLNNWVRAFNTQGIDGLIDDPRSGRPRTIPEDQTERLRDLIRRPDRAELAHWTAKKFHGHLRDELQIEAGYSTVVRWLHEQNFRLKVPQPWPDRQDEAAREAFVQRVRAWLVDERVELWYMDETGIEGDPRPRRRWIERGKKGRVIKNGDHIRMNVTGMVCPRTGEFYALEFTHSDTEIFQLFLEHANADVGLGRPRNLLIMDNASWHKSKSLDFGAFEPVFLPAYSPDLNPIERLWLILKAEWFTDFVAKTREALMDRLDVALRWLIDRSDDNQRTCTIKKEL
jgi:putative transposase